MSATATVLVLTDDEKLREEATNAFQALGEDEPRVRFVSDRNQLFEALRTNTIELVIAEFTRQPKELTSLVRQCATVSPSTAFAAILRPEGFAENVSESAVLIDAMRTGVCDFLRRPISTNDLRRLIQLQKNTSNITGAPAKQQGRVVSFISNKGGVGKSTLATNTGVAIARRGKQSVLLIDGSIQMGVGAALLDLKPTATLTDLARESDRLDATMIRQSAAVHSSGLHLLAAPADAVEAMEVDDVLMARVITLARQTYDVVIVDTFPMFDRIVIATLDLSDRVYIVLENVVPTLLGGVKLLQVMQRIGFPQERQSVVVNRYQRITGSLSMAEVAERMQRPIEHLLPFDKRVVAAANSGVPIAQSLIRFGGFSRALERLADDVLGLSDKSGKRSLPAESARSGTESQLNERSDNTNGLSSATRATGQSESQSRDGAGNGTEVNR